MTTRTIVLWVLGLAVYAVAFQGVRPLWEPDEGRYTAVATQMLDRGEWLVPHLHPEVEHLAKPPLTYWAIAMSMATFGRTELAVRLPNAVAFTITILLVVVIAHRFSERSPAAAGTVYATSLGPFIASNVVTADTLLTLWVTASFAAMAAAWTTPSDRRARWWATAGWAAAGLAFLTKGPPGLLVPITAGAALVVVAGRPAARRLIPVQGVIAFVVIGLGWFVVLAHDRPGLLQRLVHEEVVGRLISDRHRRGADWSSVLTIYLPVLVVGLMPWLAVAGRQLARVVQVVRPASWRGWRHTRPTTFVLVLSIVAPLAILLLARSRQPLYLLPVFSPVTILLARVVTWPPRRWAAVAIACWALTLLGIRAAGPMLPSGRSARTLAIELRSLVPGPIDEVVVVNDVNRFGLTFYLACDVGHVALAPHDLEPHVTYRTRLLSDEIEAPHGRRVYLVPEHSIDRFRVEADRLGLDLDCDGVGRVGKMFVILRDSVPRPG